MKKSIQIEVSPGELIDRLTILEIKMERLNDEIQLANVTAELASILAIIEQKIIMTDELQALRVQLREVNSRLWDVENAIRNSESLGDFGPDFVVLARTTYRTNDRRSQIKRAINQLLNSRIFEEKSYPPY